MTILVVLVPLALALGLAGLAAFLWSLRNGQYDDMDGAAVRILADDDLERGGPDKDGRKHQVATAAPKSGTEARQ